MADHGKPPFRADHVGSLLRPARLLEARDKHARQEISDGELREVEDSAIRDAVALQEKIGLEAITDGEYRRTFFHIDFLEQIEGITVTGGIPARFRGAKQDVEFAPPKLVVTGKLKRTYNVMGEDARKRPATQDEITAMQAVVRDCVKAGAFGFSSSYGPVHFDGDGMPVPSRFAEEDETVALASTLKDFHRGTVCVIPPGIPTIGPKDMDYSGC